ncbi:MAG: type II toxin-antitoxin system RelE/ParE family toxin [Nitrosopumilaceae archaeon]|nr:type II toxin-antitoxin system RelE/ParE family toxin [Nitrosopumilaceae archaeon]
MIISFKDKETEKIWEGTFSRKFPKNIQKIMRRKLRILNNAKNINDLRIPPNNRLEKLKGNREGQYSIRVNDQYRVCFIWHENNASNVEIVDYH